MMADFFNPLDVPDLPRLGDTPFAPRSASARVTAGLDAGASSAPVLADGPGGGIVDVAKSILMTPIPGTAGIFDSGTSWVNQLLLGLAGIVVIGVGTFILVKE